MPDTDAPAVFLIEGYVVDPRRRDVRTRSGDPVELPARAFDVLVALLERAGQDVSRGELLAAGWPSTVVEDNSLDRAVSAVRRALGDSPARPRYVLTIPGRGYRFIGEVRRSDAGAAALGAADGHARPAAATSPDASELGDASNGAAVGVASRGNRPGRARRVVLVASAGVAFVVAILWAARTQVQPVREVERPVDSQAFAHHSAGLYHWQRREPGAHAAAVREFEAAVRLDPAHGAAWSSLSGALVATAVFGTAPPGRALPRALEAARRAVELEPDSSAAHAALGHALVQTERRFDEGEERYRHALQLDPNVARTRMWRAINLAHLGRLDEAIVEMRTAQRLEPKSLAHAVNLGLLLYLGRDHERAVKHLERLLEVEPRSPQVRSLLARVQLARGRAPQSLLLLQQSQGSAPGSGADLGRVYAALGRRAEAELELEALRDRGVDGYGVAYDVAAIELALGRFAAACASLARALDDGSQSLGLLRFDPAFDALRNHACYARVRERLYGRPQ